MCSIERSISSDSDSDEFGCEQDAFSGNGQKRMQGTLHNMDQQPGHANHEGAWRGTTRPSP